MPQPQITPVAYSHSWYIDDALNTPAAMSALGTSDAQWLNTETAQFTNPSDCPADFLTVLDFGHPTRKFTGHASPLDDYAMTLFGKQDSWRTYRQVEQLAKSYVDGWAATVSSCPRLHLALGTSNYNECGKATGRCDVYTAGQYWDIVTHDVMDYVVSKGYSKVSAVWLGDDLEGSWDPWPTTQSFLSGVRDQEQKYGAHAYLVDYGDAHAGACSEVTGTCDTPWTQENVYDAAWGIGWALPLPETYTARTTQRWEDIAATLHPENPMAPVGVMTECVGSDPLPVTACLSQLGVTPSANTCELSPAIGFFHMEAQDASHHLAYATNIQWIDPTPASSPATPDAHHHLPRPRGRGMIARS